MASLIDIIIDATWRGGSDTRRAQRDLGGVDKTAESTGRSARDLTGTLTAAGIAFGATALAARGLWNALEEGASIDLTIRRFNRLAESVGTTGDALRRDLRGATAGMLSDTQLMALATDLLALNLATTSDEAVRLARVVTELDMDLNELTQAMANQSTRRLDQLGISVVTFREHLGRMSDDMSDEDAYRMAFLAAAEDQIDRVGGVADTTAGDINRLTAAWRGMKEAFTLGLAEGAAGELEDTGVAAAESSGAVSDLAQAIGENLVPSMLTALGAIPAFAQLEPQLQVLFNLLARQSEETARAAAINELYANSLPNAQLGVTTQATEDLGMAASLTADEIAELASQAEGMFGGLMDMDVSELERQLAELPTRIRLDIEAGELERLTERADLFADFQADITDITRQEEERRNELTEQHEERRSEIVDEYGRRRAEEEEDWLRRRARQEQRLRDDILETQQESAERRADLREEADDRLADLEQGHADRMQDIIENANHQLRGAASRLDAAAVARINEQRDRALSEEEERYADMRSEIMETLAERIEAEREAEQERIRELEENLAERQRIEEEDRRIRLRKMEEAHRRQLQELDDNHRERLSEIAAQAQQERNERERQYQLEHSQLVNFWDQRQQTGQAWMRAILDQEEAWWEARAGEGGFGDATTPGGGSDDDGTLTTTGEAGVATRMWMERTALRVANPRNTEEANAWSRFFNTLSDQALADWIEANSDIDVPGYRYGLARVPRDNMLAMLHRDEAVLTAQEATMWRAAMGSQQAPSVGGFPSLGGTAGGGGITIEKGAINMPIHGAPGQSPQDIGREVERSLRRVFERLGS